MKVLIVEDDQDKSEAIKLFLENNYSGTKITVRESVSSGLNEIICNTDYDLVALDMSMPAYDVSDDDPTGGGAENFGGCEFLEQMQLREIEVPVIVISQLSTFGTGTQRKTLSSLSEELHQEFESFYKGSVFYTTANHDWQKELNNKISELYIE
ncbi:TPA: response regulator [Vibrio parahaemolyticus]